MKLNGMTLKISLSGEGVFKKDKSVRPHGLISGELILACIR